VDNFIRGISPYIQDFDKESKIEDFEEVVSYYIDYLITSRLEERDLSVEEVKVLSSYYYNLICEGEELETVLYIPQFNLILYTKAWKYEELKNILQKQKIEFLTSLNITKNESTDSK
jgi:hypothetical protein